jgi:hypothetical protein
LHCLLKCWHVHVAAWVVFRYVVQNTSHLQEIADAGLPLPSVNQCPFSPTHVRCMPLLHARLAAPAACSAGSTGYMLAAVGWLPPET